MLRKGDVIECVRATNADLTLGKHYVVARPETMGAVQVKTDLGLWRFCSVRRFVKVGHKRPPRLADAIIAGKKQNGPRLLHQGKVIPGKEDEAELFLASNGLVITED